MGATEAWSAVTLQAASGVRIGVEEVDRFRVVSITGYPITSGALTRGGDQHEATIWHVHDTAVNYRLYGTFTRESSARRTADRLNAGKPTLKRWGQPFRPTCPYCCALNRSTARKCEECGGRLV